MRGRTSLPRVRSDQAAADAECLRRQIEKMRGLEIGSYAYDLDDITGRMDVEEVKEALPFCNFGSDDFNNWIIPKNLTDEQMVKVCAVFDLQFFTVVAL